jgi:hypothetical protein
VSPGDIETRREAKSYRGGEVQALSFVSSRYLRILESVEWAPGEVNDQLSCLGAPWVSQASKLVVPSLAGLAGNSVRSSNGIPKYRA